MILTRYYSIQQKATIFLFMNVIKLMPMEPLKGLFLCSRKRSGNFMALMQRYLEYLYLHFRCPPHPASRRWTICKSLRHLIKAPELSDMDKQRPTQLYDPPMTQQVAGALILPGSFRTCQHAGLSLLQMARAPRKHKIWGLYSCISNIIN